jgi:RNA polymerase sigma-70 factor (ECF subfamily)
MAKGKRCPDFAAILREAEPDAALHNQIAQCFRRELTRQATHRCRDTTLAEDAAHDALVTAFQALETFRGESSLDHWLRRLVTSSCSRLRRGRKNDPTYNLPFDETSSPRRDADASGVQETEVLLRERFALLQDALADISDENRELFLLHEGQDVPLAELAARYETTVDAIKGRLKRTRANLRSKLIDLAEAEV